MPAINQEQVVAQIKTWKEIAAKVVETANLVEQTLEHDDMIGQNWNNLETDWPNLVDNGTVVLDGKRQPFDPQAVNKLERVAKALNDLVNGNTVKASTLDPNDDVVDVPGNPLKDIRRLLDSAIV